MTLTQEPARSGTSSPLGCSPKPKPNVMKNQVERPASFSPKPKPCTTDKMYRLLFGNNPRKSPFETMIRTSDTRSVTGVTVKEAGVPMAKPFTRKRMTDVF